MRIAVIPGCLALLPEHASLRDPVAELRAAALDAVDWLAEDGRGVEVVGTDQGRRVAESLLAAAGVRTGATPGGGVSTGSTSDDGSTGARSMLVVVNGSACRTEKAPGFLDERAEGFDALVGAALRGPAPDVLADIDEVLAKELWADVAALPRLADLLRDAQTVGVDYDAAPYGVQYWVIRWQA